MAVSKEELYLRIGQMVETLPSFTMPPDTDQLKWLAHAIVLVGETEGMVRTDAGSLKSHMDNMVRGIGNADSHARQVAAIMYRALARAEMNAPVATRGAFLAAEKPMDVFALLGGIFSSAKRTVRVVDPYLDEKIITDFVGLAPEAIPVQLLAGNLTGRNAKPAFKPAVERFSAQYGTQRPIEARVADPLLLHDRLIDVDGTEAWIVTQSFNAIASRSPATISRAPAEVATSKIAFYADLWNKSAPL
jgi:hypothetical protein